MSDSRIRERTKVKDSSVLSNKCWGVRRRVVGVKTGEGKAGWGAGGARRGVGGRTFQKPSRASIRFHDVLCCRLHARQSAHTVIRGLQNRESAATRPLGLGLADYGALRHELGRLICAGPCSADDEPPAQDGRCKRDLPASFR